MKKINPNLLFRKPEAALFDTDNTLYDYDPAKKLAEEKFKMVNQAYSNIKKSRSATD